MKRVYIKLKLRLKRKNCINFHFHSHRRRAQVSRSRTSDTSESEKITYIFVWSSQELLVWLYISSASLVFIADELVDTHKILIQCWYDDDANIRKYFQNFNSDQAAGRSMCFRLSYQFVSNITWHKRRLSERKVWYFWSLRNLKLNHRSAISWELLRTWWNNSVPYKIVWSELNYFRIGGEKSTWSWY